MIGPFKCDRLKICPIIFDGFRKVSSGYNPAALTIKLHSLLQKCIAFLQELILSPLTFYGLNPQEEASAHGQEVNMA